MVCAALLAGCGASLTSPGLGSNAALGSPEQGEAALGIGTPLAPGSVTGSATGSAPRKVVTAASQAKSTDAPSTAMATAMTTASATVPASDPTRIAAAKAANGFIAASAPGNTSYKIGPHDVVEVAVFQVPELSKVAQVSDLGSIGLPLLGEVPASGRTAQELERDLVRQYGAKYLQKPQVSVMVKEYNSQRITLEGAVKKPGVYPMRGKTSLLQTIALAEGFGDTADTTVVVFRQTAQGRAAARFDVSEIRAGTAEDPQLQSGDVVVVSTSMYKETIGNVMKILPLASVFALL